jgi:hypothetical protein
MLIENREKREMSGGSGREKRHLINDNRTTLLPRMDMIACMFSFKLIHNVNELVLIYYQE